MAQGFMKTVKNRIKELTDTRMAQTRPLDESKSKIMAFFATPLEKLEKAKNYLDKIMVNWTEIQEAKRKEKERRLHEEAHKRAEEEALKEAIEAEAAGDNQGAEEIIRTPVYVPPIKVMSEIPKSKGSYIRETWNAEIFDFAALIQGMANGKVSLEAASGVINLKKWAGQYVTYLNGKAQRYTQKLNIPGVRAISKKTQI
jgi:hypothetical protein